MSKICFSCLGGNFYPPTGEFYIASKARTPRHPHRSMRALSLIWASADNLHVVRKSELHFSVTLFTILNQSIMSNSSTGISLLRKFFSIGLCFDWQARPSLFGLIMRFLFVGPKVCLRLPSDSASRRTPLPLANASCYRARSGLSPLSCCPCRAHQYSPEHSKMFRDCIIAMKFFKEKWTKEKEVVYFPASDAKRSPKIRLR
mgnify:CR=1 FL=1